MMKTWAIKESDGSRWIMHDSGFSATGHPDTLPERTKCAVCVRPLPLKKVKS